MSRNAFKRHFDLLLKREEDKRHHVHVKDFSTFMCDHTLRHDRKHFCRYYSDIFSTKEILKYHIDNCFKINGKKRFK